MERHAALPPSALENISQILGDTSNGLTGSEIARFLKQARIIDTDPSMTKWKRLYNAFANHQNTTQCSNQVLNFISLVIDPTRYIGRSEEFESLRHALNMTLSFVGMEIGQTGKYRKCARATTITEAESRALRLKNKLEIRGTHPRIFQYCRAELLDENYFHAVFEAVKSIAEVIRQKTGISEDGNKLIDIAFCGQNPVLKINNLLSETQRSEQSGFSNLMKGLFGMFRNTTAHAAKITWNISEEDALDILSTISLIHRKLDDAW